MIIKTTEKMMVDVCIYILQHAYANVEYTQRDNGECLITINEDNKTLCLLIQKDCNGAFFSEIFFDCNRLVNVNYDKFQDCKISQALSLVFNGEIEWDNISTKKVLKPKETHYDFSDLLKACNSCIPSKVLEN